MKNLKDLALAKREEGATLVEILVAITIVAVILAASGLAIMSCLRIMMNNEVEDQAYQLARDQLETYRSLDYSKVGINNADPKRRTPPYPLGGSTVIIATPTPIKAEQTINRAGTDYLVRTDIIWVGANMELLTQGQAYNPVTGKCVAGRLINVEVTWGAGADSRTISSRTVLIPGFSSCI